MRSIRNSLTWRLAILFLLLALILAGSIFALMQAQIRQNQQTAIMEQLRSRAQMYFIRAAAAPGEETQTAVEMMAASNGEYYTLISSSGSYLAHSEPQKVGQSALQDMSFDTLQKILAETSIAIFDEESGRMYGSYRASLTEPAAVVFIDVENLPSSSLKLSTILSTIGLTLFVAIVTWLIIVTFITEPLQRIIQYTNNLPQQEGTKLDVRRMIGEIGQIAAKVQDLSVRARYAASGMESQMEERMREYERRSLLLKAVADVGKAITSFRNLAELLEQATHLINENFGYYHAGIFLLDDRKEYAVLRAANSEGGKRMLARNHQLKVGGASIVGYVTEHAKARIALDVGADAVYFDNPDLPQTRSEMALPLVVSGQILGALDVQSTQPQAFTNEDISTLQILAEQLAVAIQNANLLNETEKALEAARMVYGDISREAWSKILRENPRIGFLATLPGATQISTDVVEPHIAKAFESGDVVMGADNLTISLPIKIRGQSIGAIRLKKSEISEAWTQEEINLAIALSDQISGALESARLYQESQQRAARESLVSEITAQISAATHTDAILRETVQEIGQTIGNVSVTFNLLEKFKPQNQIEVIEHEYTVRPATDK